MEDILNPLQIQKSTKDKPITHTRINGGNSSDSGKYHIPENQLDRFYKKIIKYCLHSGDKNEQFLLVEKMGDLHPFIVDIDIKYLIDLNQREYNDATVKEIVTFLWGKLSDLLDLSDKSKFGEIWIMEKKEPYPCVTNKNYKYKDGIHIAFPNIIIKKTTYKKCIELLKKEKQIEKIFDETCEITPDNDENTLFDGCFSSWQPYGCSKKNESPYILTKVYTINNSDLPELMDNDLFKEFYNDDLKIIKAMSMSYRKKETITYLPVLNDLIQNGFKNTTGNNNNVNLMNKNDDIYGQYFIDNNNIVNPFKIVEEEELKLVKSLVKCLSKERSEEYGKWLDVALCLHNINKDKLLEDWKEFSKQCSSYSEQECNKKWQSINNSNSGVRLGIGSLMFWAKNDNEPKYYKAKNDSLSSYIHKSVSNGAEADYLVSKVIYEYYKDEFISVNVKDEWFHFNGVRWERTLEGTILKTRIHNDIYNLYSDYESDPEKGYRKKMEIAINQCDDEDEKQDIRDGKTKEGKWLKNILTIKMKLLQGNYVNGLMKNVRDLFYQKEIMEKFDTDNDLLGFENGIYDLKNNVFREGRPEDYLTLSTRVSFPVDKSDLPIQLDDLVETFKKVDNYNIFYDDMVDFITKIVPVPSVRDYTLRFLSKLLSGENRDEGFYIWTGTGGNGKSKLIDLMSMCMGDYICNLPVALLTQKRKASGAASPEMAVTKGKRLSVMQEPDVNETLNVGQMKEITGNDKIQARGLYKEPFEFTPQFKLIMMCNDLPNIPSNDDGTWRRIEAVDFIARFVDKKEDMSIEHHRYLKDKSIKLKIPMWVIPFYSLLLPQWRIYDKEGIDVPDEVGAKTNSYRNENDIIGQWITEQCEIAENEISADGVSESAPTELNYLYSEFKDWCEDEDYTKEVIPNKNKFKDSIKKWQSKSRFGLKIGKKGEKCPNGCDANLKFNLKVC